jgi:hypothetical protein
VLRPHPDKSQPIVLDVVDSRVGILAHQARQRLRLYRTLWGAALAPYRGGIDARRAL